MSSYEDIFLRHYNPRPLSYLDYHLDSPVTRVPTPVFLPSPILSKQRRRPTSIASLDGLSKDFNNNYGRTSKNNVLRFLDDDHRRTLTAKHRSDSHRLPLKDITSKTHSESPIPPLRDIRSITYRSSLPLRDTTSRIYSNVSRTIPSRDNITTILDDSPKLPPNENPLRILREKHRLSLKDNKPNNFVDNYRHAVTFPDRHLSRREIPLCTPDDLLDIIREPTGYYALPTDPWNEVYPGIYLSDAPTALCTALLRKMGITHVLNAAQGKEKRCGQVNTTPGFYSQSGIQFLGVPAFDNIVFRIHPYFEEAAQFIEDALKSKGKVLVHCRAGISRSATLVCAFLMLKRGMSVQEAVKTVRKNRAIIPNDGFLQQLCDLNDRLKQKSKY